jgi:hypothetical protein
VWATGSLCAESLARAASATPPRCESVIIPEMTARRLMTHAARYFLTAFLTRLGRASRDVTGQSV